MLLQFVTVLQGVLAPALLVMALSVMLTVGEGRDKPLSAYWRRFRCWIRRRSRIRRAARHRRHHATHVRQLSDPVVLRDPRRGRVRHRPVRPPHHRRLAQPPRAARHRESRCGACDRGHHLSCAARRDSATDDLRRAGRSHLHFRHAVARARLRFGRGRRNHRRAYLPHDAFHRRPLVVHDGGAAVGRAAVRTAFH